MKILTVVLECCIECEYYICAAIKTLRGPFLCKAQLNSLRSRCHLSSLSDVLNTCVLSSQCLQQDRSRDRFFVEAVDRNNLHALRSDDN